MAQKLDYETSISIVFSALRDATPDTTFSKETPIGTVLDTSDLRDLVRKIISERVQAAGYRIKSGAVIPVEPHHTVHYVAAALPGIADVDDPFEG